MSISSVSSSALSSSSKAAQNNSTTRRTTTGIKTEMIAQNFFQRHAFAISLALGSSTVIATFQTLGVVSAVALGAAVTIATWASIKFFSSSSSAVSVKNSRVESPEEFEKAFLQDLPRISKDYGFIPFYHKDVTDMSLKTYIDQRNLYWATSPFGNFYEKHFEFEGLRFKTAEGAFQYKKLLMSRDTIFSRIANLFKKPATNEEIAFYTNCNGEEAFQAGQKIKLSDQQIKAWDGVKDEIMYSILKSKFSNDENLKKILLATGDVYLVEHCPKLSKHDHWTDGCKGFGDNMLGKLLMRLRKELGGTGEVRVPKELRDYWMFGQAVVSG